jgi:hypothetical protein
MRKLTPPLITETDPFAQLKFVFDRKAQLCRSEATARGYMDALTGYIKYLDRIYPSIRQNGFDIRTQWNEFALIDFANYVNNSVYTQWWASGSKNSLIHRVGSVMKLACQNGLTKTPYLMPVRLTESVRETEVATPYPAASASIIDSCLESELASLKSRIFPHQYELQNVGEDPRKYTPSSHFNPYKIRENQIWYFENVLKCDPLELVLNRDDHKLFARHVGHSVNFFKSLRLNYFPELYTISVIMLCLIRRVGLNVSSTLNLRTDALSINKHGIAVLKSFKARSGGDIKPLIPKEDYPYVKGLIDFTIEFTKGIRARTNSDKLFIAVSHKESPKEGANRTRIVEMTPGMFGKSFRRITKVNGLSFNLTALRLRSTFINDVLKTAPTLEAQNRAAHKRLNTTLKYGHNEYLSLDYQKNTSKAFELLLKHSKHFDYDKLYRTPIGYCANPFEPPFLNSKGSQPCMAYHKCLGCSNYKVTPDDLPNIFRFYLDIISSIEFQNGRLPNQSDYDHTVFTVATLLNQTRSFPNEIVRISMQKALNEVDMVIDPLVAK